MTCPADNPAHPLQRLYHHRVHHLATAALHAAVHHNTTRADRALHRLHTMPDPAHALYDAATIWATRLIDQLTRRRYNTTPVSLDRHGAHWTLTFRDPTGQTANPETLHIPPGHLAALRLTAAVANHHHDTALALHNAAAATGTLPDVTDALLRLAAAAHAAHWQAPRRTPPPRHPDHT